MKHISKEHGQEIRNSFNVISVVLEPNACLDTQTQLLKVWWTPQDKTPNYPQPSTHSRFFSQPPCHRTTNPVGGRPEDVQNDDTNDYTNDDSKEPEQIVR